MGDALLRTSLHDRHVEAGARLGPFAGWDMPLHYGSPSGEHRAVRERLGVFDISHMGQIEVTGAGGREYLQHLLTNDLSRIGPGEAQYCLMLREDGGAIDDLIVYALLDRFLLVVNAANTDACREWVEDRAPGGLEVADRSREVAMLALQGPRWKEALGPLLRRPGPLALEYFGVTEEVVADVPCLVARTGYTGEPGVELMCPAEGAPRLWDALQRSVEAPTPCGLVARDTLRLEMGYPLYGQELSRQRTPIEAGLKWACDLEGGFVGDEVCRAQAAQGTAERLAAFRLTERGIPRPGQEILVAGQAVGRVTSGTLSPTLEVGVGMAYVPAGLAGAGNQIAIDVRGKPKAAVTARRPLVDASPRKGG